MVFCTSKPSTSTTSAVSAKTDFMAVVNANPPEAHAPSTLTDGLYFKSSSIIGRNAGKLACLLKRDAMKFPITPSSTFFAPPIIFKVACPASFM